MQKRIAIALLGATGLLLFTIFGANAPKKSFQSKLVSAYPEQVFRANKDQKPPTGNAPVGANASPSPEASPMVITSEWIAQESKKMNRIDSDPKATLEKLKRAAGEATTAQLAMLAQTVLDQNQGENERTLALHLLVLSPKTQTEDFYKIASLNEPPSGNEFHDRFVTVLSIAALEQIQNRALENPSLLSDLRNLSEKSRNKEVRAMAKDMIRAVRAGKLITAEVQ
jgi:hypothetical protein